VEDNGLQVLIVPEGSRSTRTFRFSARKLKLILIGLVSSGLLLAVMLGSWWYLAVRSFRVAELEREVTELRAEQARVNDLARQLEILEAEYERVRRLLVPNQEETASGIWLPSRGGTSRASPSRPVDDGRPTSWPLTDRGFVTQALIAGARNEHPGLDIATPSDSYVRASGSGDVAEVGEDPVYGNYVMIDHVDGYRTVYAHASQVLVARGNPVRRNEVIALSGSTGRSTAPHLHFEILRNGKPVNPLEMVRQP